jgi:small conductance mechanosensitive channel
MAGRSNRAGGFLLPLAIVLTLAMGACLVRAQSALVNAAESARSDSSTTPSTEAAAKGDIKLWAVFHTTRVDLDWECPVSDVTQFRIERAAHGSHAWTELKTVSGTVISFSDAQAKSVDFDYRVIALAGDGTVLATSPVVQANKNVISKVLSGGRLTPQDFLDIGIWQDAINTVVIGTLSFIPKLFSAVILFGIFWLFYRLVRRIILGSMSRAHVDSSIRDMLGAILRWSILGFALVIACDQIGVQIAALLTGVSIIGLAIGFAAQETLANFIAGVVIFWDKPFKVGDWIIIDGMFGRVLRVSFRSTRMLNLNGETVVLPNTYMLANRVANHSTHPVIRVDIPIGIAYKESIDKAREALLATVDGDERICKDPPPSVVVSQCADSSVNLLLWLWIHDESVERSVFYEYLEKAKKALDAAHIEIPFPHVQLLLENTPALAGMRADSLQTQG